MDEQPSFIKNHIDTLAIIGVNIAIFAMLLTLILSNSARIDSCNARSDALYIAVFELIKERK